MKTGTWYVYGFVVTFIYFYVYAVNYVRGSPIEVVPGAVGYGNGVGNGEARVPLSNENRFFYSMPSASDDGGMLNEDGYANEFVVKPLRRAKRMLED